ncbi:hypothetical protein ACHAXA_003837 [Cyclostephanos tholiformis]|uniref:Methyltransferase domain-containing protein n=1 Tax=Cyclostephanos tholiformis TaxID=382380 RepID=A0ABD3R671_9STRA
MTTTRIAANLSRSLLLHSPPPSRPMSTTTTSTTIKCRGRTMPTNVMNPVRSLFLRHSFSFSSSSSSSSTTTTVGASGSIVGRRRKRGGGGSGDVVGSRAVVLGGTTNDYDDDGGGGDNDIRPSSSGAGGGRGGFAPRDPTTGLPLDSQSYLALASLSPWVPCPDAVVRRVLEIANVRRHSDDVHVDLGCGDGRFNFASVDPPFLMMESWGVDVDPNILERCRERLGRRFVPTDVGYRGGAGRSSSLGDEGGSSGGGGGGNGTLEFIQADLARVVDRERERYRRKKRSLDSSSSSGTIVNGGRDGDDGFPSRDGSADDDIDDITRRLMRSTVVTMYFVDDALDKLRPYLASVLGGMEDARVITVGYEMGGGWEPSWVESVLGLTIFRYDMGGVSRDPIEWNVVEGDGEGVPGGIGMGIGPSSSTAAIGAGVVERDRADNADDRTEELEEYLRRKRDREMEELNAGLRIHHDERLDEFAGARWSSPHRKNDAFDGMTGKDIDGYEDEGGGEGGWDFDETEDPRALMEENSRATVMTMIGGVRGVGKKEESGAKSGALPIWKKP